MSKLLCCIPLFGPGFFFKQNIDRLKRNDKFDIREATPYLIGFCLILFLLIIVPVMFSEYIGVSFGIVSFIFIQFILSLFVFKYSKKVHKILE